MKILFFVLSVLFVIQIDAQNISKGDPLKNNQNLYALPVKTSIMLQAIKKIHNIDTAVKNGVKEMNSDINELKSDIMDMTARINDLKSIVESKKQGQSENQKILINGVSFFIVVIESHEYLCAEKGMTISIIHMESCPCRKGVKK